MKLDEKNNHLRFTSGNGKAEKRDLKGVELHAPNKVRKGLAKSS
jgi:hypothetical protein